MQQKIDDRREQHAGTARAAGCTQMPTSGRLMTTSIRLPIHIEAIMPQNSSGCLVITCGPGTMPWMVMAPTISAITGVRRDAEREQRNERGLRRGVVGAFRRRDALDGAAAEALGMLGDSLLERVGGKRRDHGAAARQDAEDRAEHGAARRSRRPKPSGPAASASGR